MKNFILWVCCVFFASGCIFEFQVVEGNGNRTTVEKKLDKFDKLQVTGPFRVEIVTAADCSVKVEADENLHKYLRIDRQGEYLKLRTRANTRLRSSKEIVAMVYMPKLSHLELAGTGLITSSDGLRHPEKMSMIIAGSGTVDLSINTPSLDADIAGSGTMKIKGETQKISVSIAGSGDFEAPLLMSEEATIHISGSGSARLHASTKLEVHIAGSGNVTYSGSPDVTQKVAGSGKVRQVNL